VFVYFFGQIWNCKSKRLLGFLVFAVHKPEIFINELDGLLSNVSKCISNAFVELVKGRNRARLHEHLHR